MKGRKRGVKKLSKQEFFFSFSSSHSERNEKYDNHDCGVERCLTALQKNTCSKLEEFGNEKELEILKKRLYVEWNFERDGHAANCSLHI